jgi:hypothetical protein
MEHARSQYHAQHQRTAFSEAFLAPDNLRQLEQMLNSELVPLIGQELAVDHELVDALHRFTVEMSSCGTIPADVEDANRQFAYRMLKPVVAEAIPERLHNEYMQDAAEHGREPFYQRQYRHSAMERPAESSQRHHSTITSSYMLDHPYGSTDNYSA